MNNKPIRIALLGVTGRMGKALLQAAAEREEVEVVAGTASANSKQLDRSLSELGGVRGSTVRVTADVEVAVAQCDVAIDFTLAEATERNLAACLHMRRALVIGTTGHSAALKAQIAQAGSEIPVLAAANMSLGVNLLLHLVELAAARLDAGYDLEIFEAHHRNKKDAPSGTALALGEAAAKGRGVTLATVAEYSRHEAAQPRRRGSIGFSVFRGGDVVGDHTVTFAGIGERLELSHRASDRMAFARGAMQAACWLANKPAGSYSMREVLGL